MPKIEVNLDLTEEMDDLTEELSEIDNQNDNSVVDFYFTDCKDVATSGYVC